MANEVHAVTEYRFLKDLCHAVKEDHEAAEFAGFLMTKVMDFPQNAILIPMPSHCGYPTYTYDMCRIIKNRLGDLHISNCLRCNPHPSLCEVKRKGLDAESVEVQMSLARDSEPSYYKKYPVILIDNVIDTGKTYEAALKLFPDAHLYVLGITDVYANKIAESNE